MEEIITKAIPVLKETILRRCDNLFYIIGENVASIHDTWLRIPIENVEWGGSEISIETEMIVYFVRIANQTAYVIVPFAFWLDQF